MAGIQIDGVNNKIDFDDDADTSISSATDDTLVVEVGGNTLATATATSLTINDGVTITTADNTDTLTLKSTDTDASVGPVLLFNRDSASPAANDFLGTIDFQGDNSAGDTHDYIRILSRILSTTDGSEQADLIFKDATGNNIVNFAHSEIAFNDDSIDRDFRVESNDKPNMLLVDGGSNSVKFNTTSDAVAPNSVGVMIRNTGDGSFRVDNGTVLFLNRFNGDGLVVKIHGDGIQEGDISMSFNTVSYNAFTGSHWSRLADNSKPTILRGTIMDSIDEMCDWYQAVADVAESTDNEGNVTPAHTVKESIALGSKSVGDEITFISDGTEYTGTIIKEDDVKHVKCKISDTVDSKKVYGVFLNWDDADDGLDGDVNDMKVAQVGTFIIRVNKDVTVEAGDLLVSNGDGTAKLQDDDIIRSKTVAKVNSNVKIETYSDGSYTVPCTLHC